MTHKLAAHFVALSEAEQALASEGWTREGDEHHYVKREHGRPSHARLEPLDPRAQTYNDAGDRARWRFVITRSPTRSPAMPQRAVPLAGDIRELRKALGLTQAELATLLGLSAGRVVRAYEAGRSPAPPILDKLRMLIKLQTLGE